jgi:hypothetical protein
LLKMLGDLKQVDSKTELLPNGMTVPDAYIKEMSIGGK